ncbi:hypothetical protein, partial [Bacillus sp. LR_5]|uniref:hypothetical protein n=1 Tax=Bacillus sp. LR_5 TaxID=3055784 RepID=UPI000A56EEE0
MAQISSKKIKAEQLLTDIVFWRQGGFNPFNSLFPLINSNKLVIRQHLAAQFFYSLGVCRL